VVWLCLATGAVVASGALIGPRVLRASGGAGSGPVDPLTPEQRALAEALEALLQRSHRVLAVHQRGSAPLTEVLLWLTDETDPGRIEESELGLLSHSRALHTLTLTTAAPAAEAGRPQARAPSAWDPDDPDLVERAFCDWWRARRDGLARVLARGLSDMTVEHAAAPPPGRTRLVLTLTWSVEPADHIPRASVLVDVRGGRLGARE
jgi:hypothetical protein